MTDATEKSDRHFRDLVGPDWLMDEPEPPTMSAVAETCFATAICVWMGGTMAYGAWALGNKAWELAGV